MSLSTIITVFFESPWKLVNELWRICLFPLIRLQFYWEGIWWKKNWRIYGFPILQIHRKGKITIGHDLKLRSSVNSNPLSPYHPVVLSVRNANATIKIGNSFAMTGGSIVAEESIMIGDRVMVGANSIIIDTDFHPLDSQKRSEKAISGSAKPVVIGNDVFIGTGAIILKGTTIGDRTVISAGSVVKGTIPPDVLVEGNPATVVKRS